VTFEPLIYHYCGPDAFLKIVQSKEIWLSHQATMNDSEEGKWLLSVMRRLGFSAAVTPF
jgi:hypothetical protein